jgi:hypothetical protein
MRTLPETMIRVLSPFAPLSSQACVAACSAALLVGAILAPGKRTVASTLRALGLHGERRFCRYQSGFEPREVVEPGGESYPGGIAPRSLRERRTTGAGRR